MTLILFSEDGKQQTEEFNRNTETNDTRQSSGGPIRARQSGRLRNRPMQDYTAQLGHRPNKKKNEKQDETEE